MLTRKGIKGISLIVFLCLIVSNTVLNSQLPVSTRFINLDQEDGLKQNSVSKIIQDNFGFIWVGTPNGLYRHDGYNFESFNHKSGDSTSLVSNGIINLYNDSGGYIWACTSEGLSIFDPYALSFYTPSNFKKGNQVNSVIEGPKNTFWVGSKKGLYVFVRENDQFLLKRIFNKNPSISKYKGLSNENITQLCFDNDSNLWMGTGNGLIRLNNDSFKKIIKNDDSFAFDHLEGAEDLYKNILEGYTLDVQVDPEGFVYVLKRSGLYKLNNKVCDQILLSNDSKEEILLRSIYIENDSTLWVGTRNDGLIKLTNGVINQYKHSALNSFSISSNQINSIFKDRSNVLWLGCARGGISKFYLRQKEFKHFYHIPKEENSLSHNQVNTVFEDSDKNIWVATYGNGVDVINHSDEDIKVLHLKKHIPFLSKVQVYSISQDIGGNIWMGTSHHGMLLLTKSEFDKIRIGEEPSIYTFDSFIQDNIEYPLNNASEVRQVSDNEYWIGSFSGEGLTHMKVELNQITNPIFHRYKKDLFSKNGLNSNNISAIYKGSKGVLWVGTRDQGLVRIIIDKKGEPQSFSYFRNNPHHKNSLTSNRVFAIEEDNMGKLWVGTFGGGINILEDVLSESDTSFIHVNESNGLSDNSIYGILSDDKGGVWVSSDLGLSKIDENTLKVRNFNESDGVQKGNFRKNAYYKGKSGNLFFGGIYGITKFNPLSIKVDTTAHKTLITQLYIQGKKILPNRIYNDRIVLSEPIYNTDQTIKLLPSERSFHFEFLSTSFANPNFNRFKYKMIGLDEEWRFTDKGENTISFSNLRYGDYIFEVKALNPDGLWSKNIAKVNIEVLPPFYLSSIAFAIYILLIFVVFILFRRIIIFRQKLTNDLKIEQIEKQKIKDLNNMKLSFFTNISHEFRTPLTLILAPLENLLNNYKLDRNVIDNLKVIQSNSNRMLRLVNQLMEFRKVESGHLSYLPVKSDVVGFVKEMMHSFVEAANQQSIKLIFESDYRYVPVEMDKDKMEKIIYNLISNALKNTSQGDTITVRISKGYMDHVKKLRSVSIVENVMDAYVSISIKDTGKGIPEDQISNIFKRFYQVSSSHDNLQNGTGIGLSMVKTFVEIQKGNLIVQSTPEVGSNFIIQLPIDVKEEKELAHEGVENKKIDFTKGDSGFKIGSSKIELPRFFTEYSSNKRPLLLIVEDNKEICEFLKQAFEKYFEILLANNGKQGCELAIEKIPELIISDVMMPEKDGIELTNELKTNNLTSHIPIILLTAKGAIENRIEGIKKGADSFIPKPFKLEHLAARMEQLLNLRQTLREKYQKESNLLPEKKNQTYSSGEMTFLQNIEKVIDDNLTNTEFGVGELESALSLSRMQLYRKLKSLVGIPANEFIRDYRLRRAAVLLSEGEYNITEIIYKTGFSNHSYFTRSFKKKFGKSPKEFSKDYNA
ncbi:response regulator [Labilibacter sediminis]|nr:response regulator [Labilibacter sediminis]